MIRLHADAQDTSALRRAELQLSHQHVLHTRELLERRQVESACGHSSICIYAHACIHT